MILILDDGRGERKSFVCIIFDGGEEGMGIEEKRVAHGIQ